MPECVYSSETQHMATTFACTLKFIFKLEWGVSLKVNMLGALDKVLTHELGDHV